MADQVVKRVVIRNLPRTCTVEELSALFGQVGALDGDVFVSGNARLNGRFGFVNYVNAQDAAKSIEKFNGYVMDGQGREGGLDVQLANDNKAKKEDEEPKPSNRVLIRNLPKEFDLDSLRQMVQDFGELAADPFISSNKSLSGHFAFVDFKDVDSAQKAIGVLAGKQLDGQGRDGGLSVEFARNSTPLGEGMGGGISRGRGRKFRGGGRGRSSSSSRGGGIGGGGARGGDGGGDGRGRVMSIRYTRGGRGGYGGSRRGGRFAGSRRRGSGNRRVGQQHNGSNNSGGGGNNNNNNGSSAGLNSGVTQLYVSNLPNDYSSEKLEQLMGQAAKVTESSVVAGSNYGFVSFENLEAAATAIQRFAGKVLDNQPREGGLKLEYSKNAKRRSGEVAAAALAAAEAKKISEPPTPCARVFISNIPLSYTKEDLQGLLQEAGSLVGECFVSDNKKLSGRFGFAEFDSVESATRAITLFNGKTIDGQGREGGLVLQYSSKA